jgi:hypothetical protein
MRVYRVWRDDAYLRDMMLLLHELQVRLVNCPSLAQLTCSMCPYTMLRLLLRLVLLALRAVTGPSYLVS